MERLITLLEQAVPGIDFRNEKELVSSGKIDSIGIVSIIVMLQDEYDIELELDEMSSSSFESVEEIRNMLSKYVHE